MVARGSRVQIWGLGSLPGPVVCDQSYGNIKMKHVHHVADVRGEMGLYSTFCSWVLLSEALTIWRLRTLIQERVSNSPSIALTVKIWHPNIWSLCQDD